MKHGLTIHMLVRNEPFIFYAAKSIYDIADQILLYDTGSYDDYTLKDIYWLLMEDKARKIKFKQLPMEYDYTKLDHASQKGVHNTGRNRAWVRQQMIQDTQTDFYLIVDGDEVYYRMAAVEVRDIIDRFPKDKICGLVPILWFSKPNQIFSYYPRAGKLYRTEKVWVTDTDPDEMHIFRDSGKIIRNNDPNCIQVSNYPFAHFSKYLKPWRLQVAHPRRFDEKNLPQVMTENTFFLKRFQEGRHCGLFDNHTSEK